MPMILHIETFMCAECRFHVLAPQAGNPVPVCPTHGASLRRSLLADDRITVTIRDEADFDDPTMHESHGNFLPAARLDQLDAEALTAHHERLTAQELTAAVAEGRPPKAMTAAMARQTFVPRVRRVVLAQERETLKAKIRRDIAHWKTREAS